MRIYWIDLAILNPAALTYIKNGSCTTEYIATNIEETRKRMKYARFLPTDQVQRFIPFVLEATGRLTHRLQAFLEKITRMRRAVPTMGAENKRKTNFRLYTVRAIAITTLRFDARISKNFERRGTNIIRPRQRLHHPIISRSPAA